jgi:hypothetical protein
MIFPPMRYLRMLTNAAVGGALGALYLVVLVLQLNPQVPIASETAARWLAALMALYAPYLAVAIWFLMVVRELLASRPLGPAWLSVRLLAWLAAASAAGAAALTWANLSVFRAVLGTAAAERMRQGAVATTVLATVLAGVAILRYSSGRRGNRATAALLVMSLILSFAVPLWFRGPGEFGVPAARPLGALKPPVGPRVRVRILALDGASLSFIRERVAAGQLPNFGNLLDRGATVDLATLKPTQSEPVWAAAATGKYPPKTGIRSNAIYRVRPDDVDAVDLLPDYCFSAALVYQGFVREERLSATSLRARPLWAILGDHGLASGVVGWPLTHPAHADLGYIVSNYFDEAASSPLRLADPQAADPTTAVDIAREVFDLWLTRPWQEVLPSFGAGELQPNEFDRARWDRAYSESAAQLEREFAPRLTSVRYEGLDVFGHWYLRDAQPERFGELRARDRRRSVLDRYYTYIDEEIGHAVDALSAGDLLLVVAGFGMEPETLAKRALAPVFGWPRWTGTHEGAPDGFLMAYGTNVAPGEHVSGSIVDLAPTVLYYMGLPVGRDMDGFARTDIFLRSYANEHPVTYIATHER